MFSLTAIRIIENSPGRLHIVVPPNYYLGALLVLISFSVGLSLARIGRRDQTAGPRPISLLPIIVSLPIGIAGIAQLTSRSELMLSSANGNMVASHSHAGMFKRTKTVPVSGLR